MPYSNPKDPRQLAANKRYYAAHKTEYLARNRAKKQAIREWIREQKDRPCMDCGKRYPHYVMDFDHRPDEEKLYEPTRLYTLQSWKKARAEIAKCDVVCANCHRERTFGSGEVREVAAPVWGTWRQNQKRAWIGPFRELAPPAGLEPATC